MEPMEKNERKLRVEVKPISVSSWNVIQTVAKVWIEGVTADAMVRMEIADGQYADALVVERDSSKDNVWLVQTIAG